MLGLGPSAASADNGAELFINKLYQSSVIDSPVFSMYLTKDHDTSYMYFGGYDQVHVKEGQDVHYINLISNSYWMVPLASAKIGDLNI